MEDPGKPDAVAGDRGDDDAVHLSREQVLDEVAFHVGIVLGLDHDQQVVVAKRGQQRPADEVAAVVVGDDLVGDQADRARDLGPQAAGGEVGSVTQLSCHAQDTVASLD